MGVFVGDEPVEKLVGRASVVNLIKIHAVAAGALSRIEGAFVKETLVKGGKPGKQGISLPIQENEFQKGCLGVLQGMAFSGTNTLRFMDLDFDGSPELVIESPTNGSGAFTNRYIFQRQSENIERVNESFDLGSGWDEISLMRDRETGEYFYLGFDHFQDGAIMGFDLWAKLAMRDGQLEGTRLFSHGWDEPLDSYYGSGSEPITQEEFELYGKKCKSIAQV